MIKQVPARPDWDAVQTNVMEDVIRTKFSNVDMRNELLLTMDAQIMDEYLPDNLIGKAMMKVREELKA
jgi:predicted NAD-dependent protein-ADP-ribosyltransferase YbiA (DUF1768 family)